MKLTASLLGVCLLAVPVAPSEAAVDPQTATGIAGLAVTAIVASIADANSEAHRLVLPIDRINGTTLTLNERVWYVGWGAVVPERAKLYVRRGTVNSCYADTSRAGASTVVLPFEQLSFHSSNRVGPTNATLTDPAAYNGNNQSPWGLSRYDWIVPDAIFSRQDYFVLQYLLDVGYGPLRGEDHPEDHSDEETITAKNSRTIVDFMREYAWAANKLDTTGSVLSDVLGPAVFPAHDRCLQILYAFSKGRRYDGAETPLRGIQAMVAGGMLDDLCDSRSWGNAASPGVGTAGDPNRGCVTSPQSRQDTLLSATFRLPVTKDTDLAHFSPRTITVADWSNFFFTDAMGSRDKKYAGSPSYSSLVVPTEGRGFVSMQIPLYLNHQPAPVYVPFSWTVGDLERAYPFKVVGIRRACEFFTSDSGDCTAANFSSAEGDANKVISKADHRVTIWFGRLRKWDAIHLAAGHPNDYVRVREADKQSVLLAAHDYVYVSDDAFGRLPAVGAPKSGS